MSDTERYSIRLWYDFVPVLRPVADAHGYAVRVSAVPVADLEFVGTAPWPVTPADMVAQLPPS